MADILIRKVRAFGPEDLGLVDIALTGGRIEAVGSCLPIQADREIDASGLVALPGLIETHAHMLLAFAGTHTMNDFYDGTKSGVYGGVTCLVDFADQVKGGTAQEALEKRLVQARESAVDYGLHITLTDITEETLAAIPGLIRQGYPSFKFYTTYSDGGLFVSQEDMRRAFFAIAKHGGLATVHAELEPPILKATQRLKAEGKTGISHFPESKPDDSETEAIRMVIALCRETGCPVLIRHISSAQGARLVVQAQRKGLSVYGETCPHYLWFTREVYTRPNGADYIVHPPIRGREDREALWEALQSSAVFTIGTDDCAFYMQQKRVSDKFYEVPGGVPGIETRFFVLYQLGVAEGRIDHERFARLTSTYPAQIYGLYPRKGTLRPGSDGDLLLLDPRKNTQIQAARLHEKSDYSPFEGFSASVGLVAVFAGGRQLLSQSEFDGVRGAGRRLTRGCPRKLEEIE